MCVICSVHSPWLALPGRLDGWLLHYYDKRPDTAAAVVAEMKDSIDLRQCRALIETDTTNPATGAADKDKGEARGWRH